MGSQQEREEFLKRNLETKIRRYPLRQYMSLGKGFDMHLRPNYYESEQEEEVNIRNRRRRKSTPIIAEDEVVNENKSNPKMRRRSEGSGDRLEKTENKSDGVCVTQTLKYTTKKQVIELYQTGRLKAEVPQKSDAIENYRSKMGIVYADLQKKKVDENSKSNGKNEFFTQLGLKRQQVQTRSQGTQYEDVTKLSSEAFTEVSCQPYDRALDDKLKRLQGKRKRKPSKYCYIHKKMIECAKIKPLGKLRKSQKARHTLNNNKMTPRKLRKIILALKEERRSLYRIKLALKKVICSEETCIKFCKPVRGARRRKRNQSDIKQLQNVENDAADTSNMREQPSNIVPENMFPDEPEEDQDLRDLIAVLTDSIDTDCGSSIAETGTAGTANTPQPKPPPDDVCLDMTMEHYKKRLIHQHEKPSGLSSPFTEEEEDSSESPLSPASSGQSRESGQQDRRREDVVQKVARKRAVCRSQFRHQSMELFKLGSSIPTSLCKTREPYNVCTGKNLQMCYQNGGPKNGEKNPPRGSLTESIINTIDGGKRKEVPLWRSVSLNSDISERQTSSSGSNPSSGRHILPAIIPELPERRKARIKSLPESGSKSLCENHELEKNKSPSEVVEDDETRVIELSSKKSTSSKDTQENSRSSMETIRSPARRKSITSESDVTDCTPMNLSLKKRDATPNQPTWTELFNVHNAKRGELNTQHLAHPIPKQPSNVPKRPVYQQEGDVSRDARTAIGEDPTDNEGKCYFVTAIPSNALDPQKQSNVIVINFPHIQQQMSRMESPNVKVPAPLEAQQTHLEMMDSGIMSLINIVKSSVESAFNILSLPVLNRLYMDLNRYLQLSTVSVPIKTCIEDALNALISYLLANLFRSPANPKTREFVHKLLQLDLRPHMDFLVSSLDVIQHKIKYDYFMDHLLKVLSRHPQEDFAVPLPGRPFVDFPGIRPPPYLSNQNRLAELRDYPPNRFWGLGNAEFLGNQQQRSNRRLQQESDKHLVANMRAPDNFNDPNLAVMRPDLYLADNRCIPPNVHQMHPEGLIVNTPQQVKAKGRPKNPSKITKIPNNSPEDLTIVPQPAQHRGPPGESGNLEHRDRGVNVPNSNVPVPERSTCRDLIEDKIRMKSRPQIVETRRVSEDVLLPCNGANVFPGNDLQFRAESREIHKNSNGEHNSRNLIKDNAMRVQTMPNAVNRTEISRDDTRSYAEQKQKHFPGNVKVPTGRNDPAIRPSDASAATKNARNFANGSGTTVRQYAVSDVEQFLQTNIIVNQHQAVGTVCSLNTSDRSDVVAVAENIEKPQTNPYRTSSSEPANRSVIGRNQEEFRAGTKPKDVPDVIASTVIIKDKSMEISKGVMSSSNLTNPMDLDDVVLERASPMRNSNAGISYSNRNKSPKRHADDGSSAQRLSLVTDVSIEKVTGELETPPKLIKLTSLKRKNVQDERQQAKVVKRWPALKETNTSDVVIIENKKMLDHNQNDVTKTVKLLKNSMNSAVSDSTQVKTSANPVVALKTHIENASVPIPERPRVKPTLPVIEDISSDEEVPGQFGHRSTYESKVPHNPRQILQTMEVSHCTLIEGNVKAIQDANRHLFEKPPVYTRPVIPQKPRNIPTEEETASRGKPLANLIQFQEDSNAVTCRLKVKNSELNYPSTMDVRRFSPGNAYHKSASPGHFSPNFKPPSKPVVSTSPVISGSPVVQTSPLIPRSPAVPKLSLPQAGATQLSPVVPRSPVMNESAMTWRHWFSEEQRKGVFNFERSQSMESSTLSGRQSAEAPSSVGSDYCAKLSPDEPLCEIKFDSKLYRIKKSHFEKIPKGKLCYVRESNTFVRYFDDKQMELFISNLNLGEGGPAAGDLLKQMRGPSDMERSTGQYEASEKGEVITLSKDVTFSTDDFLSDPEMYVEEVEKVQRYVPKDFYGFYRFVTGYQIVNHHPPISFQTFLTMHNTNGIKGLFKNYISTLAEGRNAS